METTFVGKPFQITGFTASGVGEKKKKKEKLAIYLDLPDIISLF